MEERTFQQIAVAVFILGFISLFLIYLLTSPEELISSSIPDNSLIEFQATVISTQETLSGSMISLSRTCTETGFFNNKNVSSLPLNSSVVVTGRKSGDLFVIESISFR